MPGVSGVDFLVKINTGTDAAPVWTTVGGQKGATLNLGGKDIDITSKDSAGWEEHLVGPRNWKISFDAMYVEDDAGYIALENAYMNGSIVMVALTTPSGKKYSGKATVTLDLDAPSDNAAGLKGTLNGTGPLTHA